MNLKLERVKRKLSQGQLSKLSGVSVTTIVRIEKDEIETVKVETLRKIANVLGVGIVDLFFSDDK